MYTEIPKTISMKTLCYSLFAIRYIISIKQIVFWNKIRANSVYPTESHHYHYYYHYTRHTQIDTTKLVMKYLNRPIKRWFRLHFMVYKKMSEIPTWTQTLASLTHVVVWMTSRLAVWSLKLPTDSSFIACIYFKITIHMFTRLYSR